MTTTRKQTTAPKKQEICIDLPGEAVRCWRSSDNLKVILRKHRDIFFDINLTPGATYQVESGSDFYFPLDKKLVKKAQCKDGERLHLWVGRDFKETFVLKNGSSIIGEFKVSELDMEKYGQDPKIKPEPMMVVLGSRDIPPPRFFISRKIHLGSKICKIYLILSTIRSWRFLRILVPNKISAAIEILLKSRNMSV